MNKHTVAKEMYIEKTLYNIESFTVVCACGRRFQSIRQEEDEQGHETLSTRARDMAEEHIKPYRELENTHRVGMYVKEADYLAPQSGKSQA